MLCIMCLGCNASEEVLSPLDQIAMMMARATLLRMMRKYCKDNYDDDDDDDDHINDHNRDDQNGANNY